MLDNNATARNKSIRKSWAAGSTIGGKSPINFCSGAHRNNQY